MALTDHCDVFASVSEGAFNKIIANVARQRPSLVNLGTSSFVANPGLMCHKIEVAPLLPANQPRVALQQPLPVPGTGGAWGLEYCMQLSKLAIDFHPGTMPLPPELNPPLAAQHFALQLQVCGGIACPSQDLLLKLAEGEADRYPPIDPREAIRPNDKPQDVPRDPPPMRVVPFTRERIHCFCLDVFAIFTFRRAGGSTGPVLAIDLSGLEIVDIKPDGLEQSLECLIRTTISLGLLPRLRIALDDLILSLGEYGTLTIGFTPISAKAPFNPSVANDQLSVFVNVSAS